MIEKIINSFSHPLVQKIMIAILGILIIIIISKILKYTVRKRISVSENRYRGRKIISFFSYFLIIFFLTIVFSDQLGGVTVALGVAGAGIAFALQEVIASIAGWFAISFGYFYKIGDRIQLGGIKGDVIDISILRTTLMEVGDWIQGDLYNGRVVRIANSFVLKEPVFNYSGDFPFLWDEITVPIRHRCDIEKSRKLIEAAAIEVVSEYSKSVKQAWENLVEKYVLEDASVAPLVTMTLDENWITFTVRYVVEYKKRRTTRDHLYSKIFRRIQESDESVSIASSAQEITIIGKE